jgi:HK97 family phage portal protein
MNLLGWDIRRRAPVQEGRSSGYASISDTSAVMALFGIREGDFAPITTERALKVPAVLSAVSFLASSLASLPLHAYRDTKPGADRITGALQRLVNEAPNPEWSSHGWRKYFWQQVFGTTTGRGLAYIERAGANIMGIYPIDATQAQVSRIGGRKVYTYEGKSYPAADIIDVPFLLKADQLASYSPLLLGEGAINLALSMSDYASGFFAGGGVPPLALTGPMPAGAEAVKRAQGDIKRAIDAAKANGDPVFPIPPGYELKPVGFDPDKGQMTEARRFQIEEFARIYNLPPVFLQDLTHGTFTNTEQQDLFLAKHLISQWAKALEEEMNLKLFGAKNNGRFVEHNLDGLMRGDLKSRIEALARGVQTALLTPDEARALDNRKAKPGGDVLYIQGATVPLGSQPVAPGDATQSPSDGAADV